jgi:hypothetical protein
MWIPSQVNYIKKVATKKLIFLGLIFRVGLLYM